MIKFINIIALAVNYFLVPGMHFKRDYAAALATAVKKVVCNLPFRVRSPNGSVSPWA